MKETYDYSYYLNKIWTKYDYENMELEGGNFIITDINSDTFKELYDDGLNEYNDIIGDVDEGENILKLNFRDINGTVRSF